MSAVRLEVETHIVAGAATSVQNLTKCVISAGVQIDEMVISSLAAAEATLTDTEKELGVLVADIGGGTTDIAIFVDGAVYHTAVLPVGGINVTNDVAIGLRTSLNLAEEIKIKHGTANLAEVEPEELLNVAVLGRVGRADDPAPEAVRDHRGADGRDLQPHPRRGEALGPRRDAAGRRRPHRRRGPPRRRRGARPRDARDAGARRLAAGRRRADGPDRQPGVQPRPSGCCCGEPTTSARSRSATARPTARTRSSRVGEWVRNLFPG